MMHCPHYHEGWPCCHCDCDEPAMERDGHRYWACKCGYDNNIEDTCDDCGVAYPGLCTDDATYAYRMKHPRQMTPKDRAREALLEVDIDPYDLANTDLRNSVANAIREAIAFHQKGTNDG